MDREPDGNRIAQYVGVGIGVCIAIGAGLGAAPGNVALGRAFIARRDEDG